MPLSPPFLNSLGHRVTLFGATLLSIFFLLPGKSKGQTPSLNPWVDAYAPSVYDEHSQIFSVARDSSGELWFGTIDRILHYTGEEWESTDVPSGMAVYDLSIDEHGRVWVAGQGDLGYLKIGAAKEADSSEGSTSTPGGLTYVSLLERLPDSLRDFNATWDVHALNDRVFFNGENVLFVLDSNGLRAIPSRKRFYKSFRIKGELWVQDIGNGLYRIPDTLGEGERIPKEHRIPGSESFKARFIRAILPDVPALTEADEMLVITESNGLFRYHPSSKTDSGQKRLHPLKKEAFQGLKDYKLTGGTSLSPDRSPHQGIITLNTENEGVLVLDKEGKTVFKGDQESGFLADYIWQTAKGTDRSGAFWCGTDNGINRWVPYDPKTFSFSGKQFEGKIQTITKWDEKLFIATRKGLYYRTNEGKWGKVSDMNIPCWDLTRTPNALLIGTGEFGVFKLKKDEKGYDVSPLLKSDIVSLSAKRRGGRFLLAASGRHGISLLTKKKGGAWKKALVIQRPIEEFGSVKIDPSSEDDPILWGGHLTKGAVRFRVSNDLLTQSNNSHKIGYRAALGDSLDGVKGQLFKGADTGNTPLPAGPVSFHEVRDRILASTDGGFYRPVKKGEKSKIEFVPDSSFPDRFTKMGAPYLYGKVHETPSGEIWTYSHKVFHLIPQKNGYRMDSLPFLGMKLGRLKAVVQDTNGVNWLGCKSGLVRYDPNIQKTYDREYPCRIREVRVGLPPSKNKERSKRDSVLFGGLYRKPTDDPLLGWERVDEQPETFVPTLPYGMNKFKFRFAAPFYYREEDLVYRSKLEGFDEQWSKWKDETKKVYTNLPEGDYTFKVQALNTYDIESRTATYRFRILPPWYRTWTAYGGYGLLGIGMIWLIVYLNGKRLRAQKRRLERIVEERTQEIREQKEKVEAQQKATEEQKHEVEKRKQEVEEAHERLSEAHREITDSIDYAQKIQYALLQSEEYVSPHLPEHFILFKPQAKVSGDFYWAREQKGFLYVAAVDCTGHGVPGAFMSMLGISQLNEIMAAHDDPIPGEVLTELRKRVVEELSSGNRKEGAKDGMDAALVKIPLQDPGSQTPSSRRIQFAGANNPLYVVKKGIANEDPSSLLEDLSGPSDLTGLEIQPFKKTPDGFEVKGDKMAVGYEPDTAEAFTTVELEVPSGAMLYLFSDGYADQFGGPKGKKFRYGPFKELLARVHTLPPEEQKAELDRVFEEWKENQEQIDDVCVIGIRIDG